MFFSKNGKDVRDIHQNVVEELKENFSLEKTVSTDEVIEELKTLIAKDNMPRDIKQILKTSVSAIEAL